MKTVTIPPQATDINVHIEQARQEGILVRAADGAESMLTAVEDFDQVILALERRSSTTSASVATRAREAASRRPSIRQGSSPRCC
jgi:hypothetical protein